MFCSKEAMLGTSKSISGFDPRSIVGCSLWLDAADASTVTGTTTVTAWNDKSGRGYSLVPGSGTTSYANSAITINSSYLYGSGAVDLTTFTFFIVAKNNNTNTNQPVFTARPNTSPSYNSTDGFSWYMDYQTQTRFYGGYPTAGQSITTTGLTTSTARLFSVTGTSAGVFQQWNNGVIGGTATYGPRTSTAQGFSVGGEWGGSSYTTYSSSNSIYEILVFNTVLSTTQRQSVEGYLAWKWGFQVQAITTPLSISTCVLWLDAADSSTVTGTTTVTAWRDKSTKAYTLAPGSGTTSYASGAITLSTSYLLATGAVDLTTFTFFVVVKNNNTNTNIPLFAARPNTSASYNSTDGFGFYLDGQTQTRFYGSTSGPVITTTGLTTSAETLISVTGTSAGVFQQWNNGVIGGTATYGPRTSTAQGFSVGGEWGGSSYTTYSSSSSIYEVVVYNSVLSTTQRQSVENYLSKKWSITISSGLPTTHPFYSLPAFSRPFGPLDIPGCSLWLDAADLNSITFTTTTPPLAYFPFDGSILDQSNVITFTTTGSVPYVTGKYGQAVSFVNAQGAVSSNYLSSTYNLPSTFTIAAWIQLPVTSGKYTFITTGPNSGYSLGNINFYVSAGNMYCSYNHIANNGAGYAVSANTWYHAAITYNSGTLLLYVNGVQSGSAVTAAGSTINGITIGGGADQGPDPYPVTGYVDDLRIYNSVLTAAQISNIYTNTQTSNLVSWKDKSGNGNNGTSIGNAGSTVWSSNGMGGYPAIAFDGATGSFSGTIASNTGSTLSMFAVAFMNLGTSVNVYPRIISLAASGSQDWNLSTSTFLGGAAGFTQSVVTYRNGSVISYQPITYGTPFVASSVYTGSSNTTYANGTTAGAGASSGNFNINAYNIGRIAGGAGFNTDSTLLGSVSEVLVYNTALTDSQRQQVEGYLAAKWGLLNNLPGKVLSPLSISGCVLWLDAADSTKLTNTGTTLNTITDKSGATTASIVGTVTYNTNTLNGLPTLGIVSGGIKGDFLSTFYVHTSFIVIKMNASGLNSFGVAFSYNQSVLPTRALDTAFGYYRNLVRNPNTVASQVTQTVDSYFLWTAYLTPSVLGLRYNGQTDVTSSISTDPYNLQSYGVGYDYESGGVVSGWQGNVAEAITYSTNLTTSQIQQIEGYLASKWGIAYTAPTLHPFKSIPPSTSQPPQFQEVTPGNWTYDWQPYLQRLTAANSGATAVFSSNAVSGSEPNVNGSWSMNLAPNGLIYTFPTQNNSYIGIINPTTSVYTPSAVSSGYGSDGYKYIGGGALHPNGNIYVPPGGNPANVVNVGVFTPSGSSGTFTTIASTSNAATDAFDGGAVLAPNGMIYLVPQGSAYIGRIDGNGTFTSNSVSGTVPTGNKYGGAALGPNGLIYCIPCGIGRNVGVIDPVANTYSSNYVTMVNTVVDYAFYGGVLAPNGKIYCVPFNQTTVGIIDTVANTFTNGPALSSATNAAGPGYGNLAYFGGCLGPDGNIYCAPLYANNILIINPTTNTVSYLSTGFTSPVYHGIIMAPNGKLYMKSGGEGPVGTRSVATISFTGLNQLPSSNWCLSPYANRSP